MADPGTLRDGRFVLLEPIGVGAQGRTFAGIDKRPPQGGSSAVAIKRFDVRGATSWKDVELAEREARVLQSLSHPNLPTYIDHFEEDGALYLVMERVEGESLEAYRQRGSRLAEADVVRLLCDASNVLDYLHSRAPPVIHRDLKPGNVIRRPDGSFAFVDFGAVRDKLRPRGGSTVVGTFGYMAPEQIQGRALPASDVYSIGATALAMLTGCEPGELPHRGLAIDVRDALRGRTASPRRGSSRDVTYGPERAVRLADVLERMLEPDPDRRASRIAPLLARMDASVVGDGARESLGPGRVDRYARRAERRGRHAARGAEHATRRAARWRGSGHPLFPWPARLLFTLLFTIGIVAVSLATQLVVPLVLGVLSLFVARRALIAAAEAVRHAGETAVHGMQASLRWCLGEEVESPVARASPEPRVRVDVDDGTGSEASEASENEEEDAESAESETIPRSNQR